MTQSIDRRAFLGRGVAVAAAVPFGLDLRTDFKREPLQYNPPVASSFPQTDPALAQEMVGAAHTNLNRVKELLAQQPSLARASYDWGFGDWEDALGAASHVGNRPIAALLLEAGARPTIFSAAMLGQLGAVKAFVDASPGIQRTLGPHSITLLSHARAGGAQSQAVVDYLVTVGGADSAPAVVALNGQERTPFLGIYSFGDDTSERFEIGVTGETLTIQRPGFTKRNIRYAGNNEFRPVGAEHVRIRFDVSNGLATAVAVVAPQPIVSAKRVL